MSKWKHLQRRPIDTRGTISESKLCIDCGLDTMPGTLNRAEAEEHYLKHGNFGVVRFSTKTESYMVHEHIWKKAGMEPWGGCPCIGCLERCIGRRLIPDDFADHVFNGPHLPCSRRLRDRRHPHMVPNIGDWESAA
jgi:hypothetical protein